MTDEPEDEKYQFVEYRDLFTEKFKTKFEEKVRKNEGGCWIWKASRDPDGYGQVRVGDKIMRAHRVSYEMYTGNTIPLDPTSDPPDQPMEIDHLCKQRRCVNYEHLEVVTHEENMRRNKHVKDEWAGAKEDYAEAKTTPEEVLELALEIISNSPPMPKNHNTMGLAKLAEAPWRDVTIDSNTLPQDEYALARLYLDCLSMGVDWRTAATQILNVTPWGVRNWRKNENWAEDMSIAIREGRLTRYKILEQKHLDALERTIDRADFKEVAASLKSLREAENNSQKKVATIDSGGGNITFVIGEGVSKEDALRTLINSNEALEGEYGEVNA